MSFNYKKVSAFLFIAILLEFMLVSCNRNASAGIINTEATKGSILISPYDNLLKEAAKQSGYDWRLLSAIAYAESRFSPDVKSKAGAIGLMQIMPRTAKNFGVPVEEAINPEINVDLAVKVLKKIEETLKFGQTSEEEKIRILLAGYNSGLGNLIEARKMAVQSGVNHNNWNQLKNFGAVNNSETRGFVEKVINKYKHYKELY